MTRWTDADLAAVNHRLRAAVQSPPAPKRQKYGNSKTTFQGQTFDSKHELETWKAFKAQELAGAIRAVIRQVSMPLPGTRRRIRIDFLVVENDGRHRWWDAKGYMAPEWALKRQQVRDAYGIDIELC